MAEGERTLADAEELFDLAEYDRVRADLAAGRDELIPANFAERLMAGENAVRVWRELRGLTQAALAKKTGVTRTHIDSIERRARCASLDTMNKLAEALGVAAADLMDTSRA